MAARQSTQRKCAVNECRKSVGLHGAHDYCPSHYRAFHLYGDPEEKRGISHGETNRFLKKAIAYTGKACLEWPFARSSGYGAIQYKGVMRTASSVVCEMVYGRPPKGKTVAAHSCDNRGCVSPKHLSWESQRKNITDAVKRNLTTTVVNPAIVREMRRLDGRIPRRQIAIKFRVSVTQTHRILDRQSWGWVS